MSLTWAWQGRGGGARSILGVPLSVPAGAQRREGISAAKRGGNRVGVGEGKAKVIVVGLDGDVVILMETGNGNIKR